MITGKSVGLLVALSLSLSLICLTGTVISGEVAKPIIVKVKKKNTSQKEYACKTSLMAHFTGFEPESINLSKYGGRLDRKEKAIGFFRTMRTSMGWILVDPLGCHFYSVGVNSVAPNDKVADHAKAFAEQFSGTRDWAGKTRVFLVDDLKFNTLGSWSDWKAFKSAKKNVPYTRRWNLIAGYGRKKKVTYKKYGHAGFLNDTLPVFDKGFAGFCDKACKEMAETKNDPWLLGHFTDNELPFKSDNILKRYLKNPAEDEGHQAARRWLKEKGVSESGITKKHDIEFCGLVLRTYYKTVHDAVRKHDPNHLILGTRVHGFASQQDITYEASGPYVDVVSINYYHRWTPEQDQLTDRAKRAGKPIMITEWYAKGKDSGLNNDSGAGFTVNTQQERGYFYENFTLGLLRNPHVVGWHWFRYIDDGDQKTKGASCNKGVVNKDFVPYKPVVESMQGINAAHYQLADYLRK